MLQTTQTSRPDLADNAQPRRSRRADRARQLATAAQALEGRPDRQDRRARRRRARCRFPSAGRSGAPEATSNICTSPPKAACITTRSAISTRPPSRGRAGMSTPRWNGLPRGSSGSIAASFPTSARTRPAGRQGRPPGEVEMTGLVRVPHARGLFAPANDVARNLWYWPDVAAMQASAFAGTEVHAVPFWLDADARPEPPGGLPRGGVTRLDLPNRHLEYALTWYGLALTLIGVYGAFAAGRLRAGPSVARRCSSSALKLNASRHDSAFTSTFPAGPSPAALLGPRSRPRVQSNLAPPERKSTSLAVRQHQRRSAGAVLRGCPAGGPCARRRALCAEDLAEAVAGGHRGLRRQAVRRGGRGAAGAVRRRLHSARRADRDRPRRLRPLRPPRRDAARADRSQPVGARAVPRADAGLQGRGHAAAVAADGPGAGGPRRARHHRGGDLGRHRRCGGRGVPRLGARRCHRALPAGARSPTCSGA